MQAQYHVREALILAGGQGTRLRAVIDDRPKPLAEICGRPFLERLFEQLIRYGFECAVLCVGYGADQIMKACGPSFGTLKLYYSRETTPLGTGGALRLAAKSAVSADLLAMNGDSFCEVDLAGFAAAHYAFNGSATVAVLHRDDRSRAGVIELDGDRRVRTFASRPVKAMSGLINTGIYMFNRDMLLRLPESRPLSLEEEVLPRLAEEGRLYGWIVQCDFIDIGTPASLQEAQRFFAKR